MGLQALSTTLPEKNKSYLGAGTEKGQNVPHVMSGVVEVEVRTGFARKRADPRVGRHRSTLDSTKSVSCNFHVHVHSSTAQP
jgi:hypothetical protein